MPRRNPGLTSLIIVLLAAAVAWGAPGDVDKIRQAIAQKGASWQAAETPFTNLTWEQKQAMLGLLPGYADEAFYRSRPQFTRGLDEVDEEVDWRDRNGGNWVTPVRDQGQCGSCWAFGGVAAMESNILIDGNAPNYPLDLSEQYLVSCSEGSCNGWYADATLEFLQTDGTVDEACLPYGATDNIACSERCDDWYFRNVKLAQWGWCANVAQMKAAVNQGPISSCFTVYEDFYAYSGGVYQHVWGNVAGGHMIAIVGYSDALQAWICKNSWGASWGDDGYFMIRMGYDECGIESWAPLWCVPDEAEYPNLTVGGSDIVETIGDGDGVLNPGETADFFVNLQNAPLAAPATGVTAQIACTDPRVTILDEEASYPNLSGSQVAANSDPFSISVAANCTLGLIEFTIYVYANESAPIPYYAEREFTISVSLFQSGYPITGNEMDASPAICDLDGDGSLDVISVDFDGLVRATDGTGNLLPGFPYDAGGIVKASPAVGDLDNDGDLEVVIAEWNGHVAILNSDGGEALAPMTLPCFISATPALGDLDGDGDLEIVVGCWNGNFYAFHHTGSAVTGFPFIVGQNMAIQDGALLLDLNGDQRPEILFGSYDQNFYAVDGSGTELWSFDMGAQLAASASAADLGDGFATIVVPDQTGGIHFLNSEGQELRLADLGHSCKCSPSFADLNGDGSLEIAVNDQAGNIHVLNYFGEDIQGFPVATGSSIWSSSSFSDLNNDGHLEVITASNGGTLQVRQYNGTNLSGFPLTLSSGSRSTPGVINLDQDGDLEIILGTFTGLDAIDYKPTAGQNNCWNTFRGNLRRTGYYGDGFLAVSVERQENEPVPLSFALRPAHPNPFNPTTVISYQLPVASLVKLEIFDISGRWVGNLVNGWRDEGVHQVAWDAAGMASGIYFYRIKAGDFSAVRKVLLIK